MWLLAREAAVGRKCWGAWALPLLLSLSCLVGGGQGKIRRQLLNLESMVQASGHSKRTQEPPPNLKLWVDVALSKILDVKDTDHEYEAQIVVQWHWKDTRLVGVGNMASETCWLPPFFSLAMELTSQVETENTLSINGNNGEVDLTKVYKVLTTFPLTPRAYPFDSHLVNFEMFIPHPVTVDDVRVGSPPHEKLERESELNHYNNGWLVRSVNRHAFVFCFTTPSIQQGVSFNILKRDFVDRTSELPIKQDECTDGIPAMGVRLEIKISREGGQMVRVIIPMSLICILAQIQLWVDLKYVGSRNQLTTLSMLTTFNIMSGPSLPMSNGPSWFEIYSLTCVGCMAFLIATTTYASRKEVAGRHHYATLYDKAFRIMLPAHWACGTIVATLYAFIEWFSAWLAGIMYLVLMAGPCYFAFRKFKAGALHYKVKAENLNVNTSRAQSREKLLSGGKPRPRGPRRQRTDPAAAKALSAANMPAMSERTPIQRAFGRLRVITAFNTALKKKRQRDAEEFEAIEVQMAKMPKTPINLVMEASDTETDSNSCTSGGNPRTNANNNSSISQRPNRSVSFRLAPDKI